MAAKRKKNPKAWTPFVAPTSPPPGTYDPGLDQQARAAERGLVDFRSDAERDTARSEDDYLTARGDVERTRGEGIADIMRSRARGLEDLDRRYARQASAQTQAINAAGALHGGALAAAMRRRAENRAYEQGRFMDDSALSESRLTGAADRDLGRLALGHQRSGEDRSTALTRAEREHGFLGQDINESRLFQAKQLGWDPPTKPQGEGQRAGINYRRQETGPKGPGGDTFLLTSGRQVTRNALLEKIRRAQAKRPVVA